MGRVPGFVKWVVSPALAALLGYGVIGPRLAGHPRMVKAVQEGVAKVIPQARLEPPAEKPPAPVDAPTQEPAKAVTPPSVTVTATPADETPKPHRRRRRHVTPSDEAPPESSPSTDRTGPDPASTP